MMRARSMVAGVVAVAVLGAGGWGVSRSRPKRKAATKPGAVLVVNAVAKKQELLITVDQPGSLAAKNTTVVTPDIGGSLLTICESGTVVSKGDVIATIDPAKAQKQADDLALQYAEAVRKRDQAKQTQEAAKAVMAIQLQRAKDDAAAFEREQQAALRDLKNQITFGEAELERRRGELDVKRRLAAKGLITGTEVEREEASFKADEFGLKEKRTDHALADSQAKAKILDKRKELDKTQQDLAIQQRGSERELRMAENQVQNLKLRLDKARADVTKTTVTAPAAGLVVVADYGWRGESRPYRAGDQVGQGQQLAQIVDLRQMQVQLELDQPRITGVKVGQETLIEIDALPGKTLKGKVLSIGKSARRPPLEGMWRRSSSETTFPVTIDLPQTQQAFMRPGMRANASIVVRRIKGAVTVPAECIFQHGRKRIVYAERDGRYQRTAIQVGASNGDYTQIVRGLKQGDRIALNDLEASAAPAAAAPAREATRP